MAYKDERERLEEQRRLLTVKLAQLNKKYRKLEASMFCALARTFLKNAKLVNGQWIIPKEALNPVVFSRYAKLWGYNQEITDFFKAYGIMDEATAQKVVQEARGKAKLEKEKRKKEERQGQP